MNTPANSPAAPSLLLAPRPLRLALAAAPLGFAALLVAFFATSAEAQTPVPLSSDAITRFVPIPAGPFQMGDVANDGFYPAMELPVHTVTLSTFFIQTTETTKAQWDEVRAWAVAHGYTDLPAGGGKASEHPVQMISWYEIVKWCNAASERAGLTPCYTVGGAVYRTGDMSPTINYATNGYRLPTEAEWEKSARGGLAGKRFPWGDTISHAQANYVSDAAYPIIDVSPTRGYHPTYAVGGTPYTSPVGSFAPNGYGLYDVAGNVWEVCGDWYGAYTADAQTNPIGPTTGNFRSIRGASWSNNARSCRVPFRGYIEAYSPYPFIGFRPARSLLPGAPLPFADWTSLARLSGDAAAPTATPFQDGVPNLLKYAFNLNASGPDSSVLTPTGTSGLPRIEAAPGGGMSPGLTVEFLRRRGVSLVYEPQESTDLATFAPLVGTSTVTPINDEWERVTITAAASAAPRRFFRVSVTQP
jgi:formylglycine-generating enzyme